MKINDMTPEEEKLDYWKPQLGDGILVGDTDFYWVSSDETVKGCPDGGGCTLNYAVDRYLDGAAVVIYRESVGSIQALQSENAQLQDELFVVNTALALSKCLQIKYEEENARLRELIDNEFAPYKNYETKFTVDELLHMFEVKKAALNSEPESGGL